MSSETMRINLTRKNKKYVKYLHFVKNINLI